MKALLAPMNVVIDMASPCQLRGTDRSKESGERSSRLLEILCNSQDPWDLRLAAWSAADDLRDHI